MPSPLLVPVEIADVYDTSQPDRNLMDQLVLDPLTRMKPQRGRRIDALAPVAYAADAARTPSVRWRLLRFTAAASTVAAIAFATVAAVFA